MSVIVVSPVCMDIFYSVVHNSLHIDEVDCNNSYRRQVTTESQSAPLPTYEECVRESGNQEDLEECVTSLTAKDDN